MSRCPKCGYVALPPALEEVRHWLSTRPKMPKPTAAELAAHLKITQESAAMRLLRLRRMELASQKQKR